jgi:hypothetical protein
MTNANRFIGALCERGILVMAEAETRLALAAQRDKAA